MIEPDHKGFYRKATTGTSDALRKRFLSISILSLRFSGGCAGAADLQRLWEKSEQRTRVRKALMGQTELDEEKPFAEEEDFPRKSQPSRYTFITNTHFTWNTSIPIIHFLFHCPLSTTTPIGTSTLLPFFATRSEITDDQLNSS